MHRTTTADQSDATAAAGLGLGQMGQGLGEGTGRGVEHLDCYRLAIEFAVPSCCARSARARGVARSA